MMMIYLIEVLCVSPRHAASSNHQVGHNVRLVGNSRLQDDLRGLGALAAVRCVTRSLATHCSMYAVIIHAHAPHHASVHT